jgi:hypothetical protein
MICISEEVGKKARGAGTGFPRPSQHKPEPTTPMEEQSGGAVSEPFGGQLAAPEAEERPGNGNLKVLVPKSCFAMDPGAKPETVARAMSMGVSGVISENPVEPPAEQVQSKVRPS